MESWTVDFVRNWRPYFSWSSLPRLRRFVLDGETGTGTLPLNLRWPFKTPVTLRRDGSDWVMFSEVMVQKVYAPVLKHLDQCEYVVDLGANVGFASLYFAGHFPCQILAVEPHPETYKFLNLNVAKLAEAGRCRTMQAAVWDSSSTLQAIAPDRNATDFSEFSVREGTGSIPGVPITEIIRSSGFPRIDLLKVDIEGAETRLFGPELSWLPMVRCIAIEFHANSRTEIDFDKRMADAGFEVFDYGHTVVAKRR